MEVIRRPKLVIYKTSEKKIQLRHRDPEAAFTLNKKNTDPREILKIESAKSKIKSTASTTKSLTTMRRRKKWILNWLPLKLPQKPHTWNEIILSIPLYQKELKHRHTRFPRWASWVEITAKANTNYLRLTSWSQDAATMSSTKSSSLSTCP